MSWVRPLALAAALAAAGALAYVALTRGGAQPSDALPASSFVAATVDVAALRETPLGKAIFTPDRALTLGGPDLASACGFDPMDRVEELDVAIPEAGEHGDFGVAFRARITEEELVGCAERLARGGGRASSTVGHFKLLEDDKGRAIAVREDGSPILVGKSREVRAMIDAAERRAPRIDASPEHAALRESLLSHGKVLALVTAVVPKRSRDAIKSEMQGELEADAKVSAFAAQAMDGVLGVSAAGLALRALDDGALEARVELRCESDSACAAVEKLVLAKRLGWSQDLALRLVGLGPLIDGLEARAHGPALTATTRIPAADLAGILERVDALRGRGKPRAPRAADPAPPRPPDEVLRPDRSR